MTKELVWEHFSGKSNAMQEAAIEQWLADPANKELYYQWLEQWERQQAKLQHMDLAGNDAALAGIMSPEKEVKKRKRAAWASPYRIYWAAASVAVCAVLSSLLLLGHRVMTKTVATGNGEVRSLVLPDGSLVTLNANSSLSYPRFGFEAANSRIVSVAGEADFSVTHTFDNRSFEAVVNNGLKVRVLGTQFSVFARDDKHQVVLRSGKVELGFYDKAAGKPTKAVLKPGDMFQENISTGTKSIVHLDDTRPTVAWKNRDFVFDGNTLAELSEQLRYEFGLSIRFTDGSLPKRKLSGYFHAETGEELLDVVAQLLGLNYKLVGKEVLFF